MVEKSGEQNSILIKLRKAEWRLLKNWLDSHDSVVVGLGGCPKAYLVNMTKIYGKSGKNQAQGPANEQRK